MQRKFYKYTKLPTGDLFKLVVVMSQNEFESPVNFLVQVFLNYFSIRVHGIAHKVVKRFPTCPNLLTKTSFYSIFQCVEESKLKNEVPRVCTPPDHGKLLLGYKQEGSD